MVQIELESDGKVKTSMSALSLEDVADMIRRTGSENDTTLTLSVAGFGEVLREAIDEAKVSLGVESPDGVYQFVPTPSNPPRGTRPFNIGGQSVDMEERYIADIEEATEVVKRWLSSGHISSLGTWEKQ